MSIPLPGHSQMVVKADSSEGFSTSILVAGLGWCGSFNVIDLHNPNGNGTLSRCGLVEIGLAFLEEECHQRVGL